MDYIRFNGTRHPREMGKPEIERFLSHLAGNRNVAISTQNQALNSILFLYKHVLDLPLNDYIDATRSKKGKRLPTVLNQSEISRFFQYISGTNELMAKLLCGTGLRLMDCIRLRVKRTIIRLSPFFPFHLLFYFKLFLEEFFSRIFFLFVNTKISCLVEPRSGGARSAVLA